MCGPDITNEVFAQCLPVNCTSEYTSLDARRLPNWVAKYRYTYLYQYYIDIWSLCRGPHNMASWLDYTSCGVLLS